MIGTLWDKFWLLTGERSFIKNFSFSACNKTRISIDTGDEASTVTRDGESRIRPEFGSNRVRWHLIRALEANHSLRVALFQKKIRPLATVDLVVVNQTSVASFLMRFTMSALDVSAGARWAVGVDAELVQAAGRADRC